MVNYLVEWQHCAPRDLVNYCWLKLMFSQLSPWNPHWDRPVEADREHVWKRLRYKTWLVDINIHQSTEKKKQQLDVQFYQDWYQHSSIGKRIMKPPCLTFFSHPEAPFLPTAIVQRISVPPSHAAARGNGFSKIRSFQMPSLVMTSEVHQKSLPSRIRWCLWHWALPLGYRDMPSGIPEWDDVDDMFIMTPQGLKIEQETRLIVSNSCYWCFPNGHCTVRFKGLWAWVENFEALETMGIFTTSMVEWVKTSQAPTLPLCLFDYRKWPTSFPFQCPFVGDLPLSCVITWLYISWYLHSIPLNLCWWSNPHFLSPSFHGESPFFFNGRTPHEIPTLLMVKSCQIPTRTLKNLARCGQGEEPSLRSADLSDWMAWRKGWSRWEFNVILHDLYLWISRITYIYNIYNLWFTSIIYDLQHLWCASPFRILIQKWILYLHQFAYLWLAGVFNIDFHAHVIDEPLQNGAHPCRDPGRLCSEPNSFSGSFPAGRSRKDTSRPWLLIVGQRCLWTVQH